MFSPVGDLLLDRFDFGGDLFGLFLQRPDIWAQVFLNDLSVFFPSFQEGLREEIAMPVRQRELMLDMRRLFWVGNFARLAEYFNRLGEFVVLILLWSGEGC